MRWICENCIAPCRFDDGTADGDNDTPPRCPYVNTPNVAWKPDTSEYPPRAAVFGCHECYGQACPCKLTVNGDPRPPERCPYTGPVVPVWETITAATPTEEEMEEIEARRRRALVAEIFGKLLRAEGD